jgi:hypothetical protein
MRIDAGGRSRSGLWALRWRAVMGMGEGGTQRTSFFCCGSGKSVEAVISCYNAHDDVGRIATGRSDCGYNH